MMSFLPCCVCLLLLSLTTAAPIDKDAGAPAASVKEVQNQEQELQSLLQLADEKSARNDVTVHEEHVQHVHEINGHKMEVDTSRKTVSDTETGEVLSDVKQEVSKPNDNAFSAQPEVQVKTEVDLPEEGVHETLVQSGSETPDAPAEAGDGEEEIDFNPETMADYLYRTGKFDRFYKALAELVNASLMTEQEAQSYSQLVALEYDRLQMEDYENNILVQRRVPPMMERSYPLPIDTADSYPLPIDTADSYPLPIDAPEGYPVALDTPEALFALEQETAPKNLDLGLLDPYDLLSALWKEAYGTGDVRAAALVNELFEKVRNDNDPDDEGQVRDIISDLIAGSVMDEEPQPQQPRYGWQPIIEEDTLSAQPTKQLVPVQPIQEAEDEEAANELMAESEKRAAEQPIAIEDTKAANEQPIQSSNTQPDQPQQPVAESEASGNVEEVAEANRAADKPVDTPAELQLSAHKRAAETV